MKKIVILLYELLAAICPIIIFFIMKSKLPFRFHLLFVLFYLLIFIVLSFVLYKKHAKSITFLTTVSIITSVLSGLAYLFWNGHCITVDTFRSGHFTCCIEQHSFPQDELVIKVYKNLPYALHAKKINIKNNTGYDVSFHSDMVYISILFEDLQTNYTIRMQPFEINEDGNIF